MSTPSLDTELPTHHELASAHVVLSILGSHPTRTSTLRSGYNAAATDGILFPRTLRRGEELLAELGLIQVTDDWVRPRGSAPELGALPTGEALPLLFSLIVRRSPPSWLPVVVARGQVRLEYLPQHAFDLLERLFPNGSELEQALLILGAGRGTVDSERRTEIGRLGEEAAVHILAKQRRAAGFPDLARAVTQVSLFSDALGFDVLAPVPDNRTAHKIEVKTTERLSGPFLPFHLSRNQVEVARSAPEWRILLMGLQGGEARPLGWCVFDALKSYLPTDTLATSAEELAPRIRWSSLEIELPDGLLHPGLPPLVENP